MDNGDTEKKNILRCACCDAEIVPGDEYYETNRGIVCQDCIDDDFSRCCMCERFMHIEDMKMWVHGYICPDCLEEFIPSFDEKENFAETEDAYNAMKERYLGRRTNLSCGEHYFEFVTEYNTNEVKYSITVTIDENNRVADISPLYAEALLWEGVNNSEWAPFPICPDDYDDDCALGYLIDPDIFDVDDEE